MNCAPGNETSMGAPQTATVVLVGFTEQDRRFLEHLFDGGECPLASNWGWAIQLKASIEATLVALRHDPIPVVLCDRDSAACAWKELLAQFSHFSQPPCLIVTSRLADDCLWAEALNLGAYDVLARPFEPAEVIRSVSLARLHWESRRVSTPITARAVA